MSRSVRWRLSQKPPPSDHEMQQTSSENETRTKQVRLLEVLFDLPRYRAAQWPGALAYLSYLEEQLSLVGPARCEPLCRLLNIPLTVQPDDSFTLIARLATIVRDIDRDGISIDELLQEILTQHGSSLESLDDMDKLQSRQAMFCVLSWLSTLLQPSPSMVNGHFHVLSPSGAAGMPSSQSIGAARRPIVALLRGFGQLLPNIDHASLGCEKSQSDLLYVSSFNFSSLQTVGKINIEWTSLISYHLMFQPSSRTLMLYRFPTVCALNCLMEERASVFDK
jgi:hypothetical protein